MKENTSRQRLYAALLALGAGVFFFRSLRMMFVEDAFSILVLWLAALLVLEGLIDLSCIATSIRWLVSGKRVHGRLALGFAAAAAVIHAFRVFIYVLGRLAPWQNFDVRIEQRSSYSFDFFWVFFAGIMSVIGLIGVIVIWQIIRFRKKYLKQENWRKKK